MKSLFVSMIKFFSKLAEQNSLLRHIAVFILKPFPSIKKRLISILIGNLQGNNTKQRIPTELTVLTPHARQIYSHLRTKIDNKQGSID